MSTFLKRNDYEIAKVYFEKDRQKAISILQDSLKNKKHSIQNIFRYKARLALLYSLENSIKQTIDLLHDLLDLFINQNIDSKLFQKLFAGFNQQQMEKSSQKYNFIKTYEIYFLILTKEEQKANEILTEISPFFERKIKLSDHFCNKIAMLYYQIKLMIAYNNENNNDLIT